MVLEAHLLVRLADLVRARTRLDPQHCVVVRSLRGRRRAAAAASRPRHTAGPPSVRPRAIPPVAPARRTAAPSTGGCGCGGCGCGCGGLARRLLAQLGDAPRRLQPDGSAAIEPLRCPKVLHRSRAVGAFEAQLGAAQIGLGVGAIQGDGGGAVGEGLLHPAALGVRRAAIAVEDRIEARVGRVDRECARVGIDSSLPLRALEGGVTLCALGLEALDEARERPGPRRRVRPLERLRQLLTRLSQQGRVVQHAAERVQPDRSMGAMGGRAAQLRLAHGVCLGHAPRRREALGEQRAQRRVVRCARARRLERPQQRLELMGRRRTPDRGRGRPSAHDELCMQTRGLLLVRGARAQPRLRLGRVADPRCLDVVPASLRGVPQHQLDVGDAKQRLAELAVRTQRRVALGEGFRQLSQLHERGGGVGVVRRALRRQRTPLRRRRAVARVLLELVERASVAGVRLGPRLDGVAAVASLLLLLCQAPRGVLARGAAAADLRRTGRDGGGRGGRGGARGSVWGGRRGVRGLCPGHLGRRDTLTTPPRRPGTGGGGGGGGALRLTARCGRDGGAAAVEAPRHLLTRGATRRVGRVAADADGEATLSPDTLGAAALHPHGRARAAKPQSLEAGRHVGRRVGCQHGLRRRAVAAAAAAAAGTADADGRGGTAGRCTGGGAAARG